MAILNDSTYIQKIVSLSGKHKVVAHRPITTALGIKLVDAGVHISEKLYEKLTRHNLLPPLDECLTVENAVTPESLRAGIATLLAKGMFGKLLSCDDEHHRILDVFTRLPLSQTLAFKLTVLREQMPDVFQHSLEVALCAVVLTMKGQTVTDRKLSDAAAAGLFHDLGLLHVDTYLLSADRRLTERECRHIYAHPVLGHLILSRLPEYPPAVSRAVLEHHERLDGSGYPQGFTAHEISSLGQLLAVAELVPALFSRKRIVPLANYVHVILRLNQGKFNRDVADLMTNIVLNNHDLDINCQAREVPYSLILADLVLLSVAIEDWHSISTSCGQLPICELISKRVERLEKNCAGVGLDLKYWGMIDGELPSDTAILHELAAAAMEGRWQLRAIAREVQRKWDKLRPQQMTMQEMIWNWVQRIEVEVVPAADPV